MSSLSPDVPPLREIYLYAAGSCNLNCRHCWIEPVFGNRLEKYLPWESLETIIDEALEIGLSAVKITGGEPFLHPELVSILYYLGRDRGLRLRMETNGTLIGAEEARALADNQVSVSLSLDGPTALVHNDLRGVNNAFDRTMSGIAALHSAGVPFQVITSIHRGNAHLLPETAQVVHDLGAWSLKVNPIIDMGRGQQMSANNELLSIRETLDHYQAARSLTFQNSGFRIIFDVPSAFQPLQALAHKGFSTCGILNILGVLHNGHAGLCGIGEHIPELDFGNLLEVGVRKIWEENTVLNELRARLPHAMGGICGRCVMRSYCFGKCVAHTYAATGDLFSGYVMCEQAHQQGLFPETRLVPAN